MRALAKLQSRRSVILFLVLAWAGWGSVHAQTNTVPKAAPRLPCVILIVADGLGYGDLGCYGQEMILTPQMNRLATGGMRFSNAYAGGGRDESSRAALLTGGSSKDGLSSSRPTLAERLKQAGYHTGFIGYWGLGTFDSANGPHRRGFEEVIAYEDRGHAHDLYARYIYRRDPHSGFDGAMALADNSRGKKAYLPDLLTRAATRFCTQNKPERLNHYRPFFLMLSYPVPAAVMARSGKVPATEVYEGMEWPALQQDKANAITRLDQHVGELMDELEQRGMAQNTIIVITSILGSEGGSEMASGFFKSTGPFSVGNQPLTEGCLRVPLIVRWPFWMKTGGVSDLLLSGIDMVPTVLEAARLEVPEGLDGISFLPTLLGRDQTNRHDVLSWSVADDEGLSRQAMRAGKWKLVRSDPGQIWQLYDLTVDPGEHTDLAGDYPKVVRQLEASLDRRETRHDQEVR